jgi:DNA-binding MarR family transcriptional regulator
MRKSSTVADQPRAGRIARGPTPPELSSRVRLAVGRLHRRFRQLVPTGVTQSRLSALASVDRSGPLSIGALAAAEGVAASTMTRLVDSLEADGLVARVSDSKDRRVARIQATEQGSRLLGDLRSEADHYLTRRLAMLGPDDLARLAWVLGLLEWLADDQSGQPGAAVTSAETP